MASIVQRGTSYCVVYRPTAPPGEKRKQIWETCNTLEKAQIRKEEIENPLPRLPTKPYINTLSKLMNEYVELYGKANWTLSTFSKKLSLIDRYIKPILGDSRLTRITPYLMSRYYQQLEQTPVARHRYSPKNTSMLTPHTIYEIHELLQSLFRQAVYWGYFDESPVRHIKIKKPPGRPTDMLTPEELKKAIHYAAETDPMLSIAMQLALSGSLRKGELLGLTWEDIDWEKGQINISKEMTSISLQALKSLNQKGVIQTFSPPKKSAKNCLVLKIPKTSSSVRTVYAPDSLLDNLRIWKVIAQKALDSSPNRSDCDLMFLGPDGSPLRSNTLSRRFHLILEACGLPQVPFRSLRHTSTTFKLALSGGNIKAVQGDTGHAQAQMVLNIYAQTIHAERKLLAAQIGGNYYPPICKFIHE